MKPHRLTLTNHLVISYDLHKKMEIFQPRRATEEEIMSFHAADYIDFLKRYSFFFHFFFYFALYILSLGLVRVVIRRIMLTNGYLLR